MQSNRLQMVTSFWNNLNHQSRICPSCDAKLQAHVNAHMHCDTISRDETNVNARRCRPAFGATTVPIQPQHESRLLRLPGELRNRIFEFAFSDHADMALDKVSLLRVPWSQRITIPVALQVCRQMRAEGLGLWLNAATFWFNFHGELYEFLRMLEPEHVGDIRNAFESYLWQNTSQAECSLHQLRRGLGYYGLSMQEDSIAVQCHGSDLVEGDKRRIMCIRRAGEQAT